ncbi:MAG TPA: DinB family protein, partial [Myxococcales bacterium]|nr:DinB family protein [Myxococcales bacterium]
MRAARGLGQGALGAALEETRAFLLRAAACLPAARWGERPSVAYSPLGWHLGHVAATQARWLLPGDPLGERFGGFFDPAQTSKSVRSELPAANELLAYLAEVLLRVRSRLSDATVPAVVGLPGD